MAGRWRDPTAFRADPAAAAPTRPSRRQSAALLLVLALVAGLVAAASYLVRPDDARTFDLFRGSVFLADTVAPVAVDLATGRPTVRLVDASGQVGAKRAEDLAVVPTADGTLLLNRLTGEFNIVESTGFVVKSDGGVPLPRRTGSTGAVGIAAQDFSYIAQTGPSGTSVYLVGSTTVQSAATGASGVKPRAFRSMDEPISTAPGAAAAVGNDLWVLAGAGPGRTVRRLSLPADSNPGVTLRSRDVATVSGPAAIATAGLRSADPTATGSTAATGTVGIASADRILVQRGAERVRTVRFTAPAGVDQVLAATNGTSRLAYLIHGSSGWATVSVAADGTDLRGPTALRQITPGARLVPPATSDGRLYTLDAASGDLVRISGSGRAESLPGMATYPVAQQDGRPIEAGGFDDAYVLARGPRVVINSPNHLLAVAVFADGSRPPVRIAKSSAVSVNAAGGAEALARSRTDGVPPAKAPATPGQPKPATPKSVDPVNNKIDCETTSQEPHIPALGQPVTGSRSVQLQWSYPVTNRTDCVPKTYVVGVKALDGGTPRPPSSVTVEGQLGVNLSGLFPSSRYEVTVTAYINGKGTRSAPIQITTGPEGPGAPRQVSVSTDDAGNWSLSWASCGTVASGCVPSTTWRVVPQFCDSRGLGSPPAPFEVLADPTSTRQPGATLRGSSALLGRGLRFQVLGIGVTGQVGTPSASTSCATSWSPPVTSALKLTASKPGDLAAGATTSTTLSLALGSDAIRTVGGVGASVTLTLDGPGAARTKTVTVDGRSSTLTASFGGIAPGGTYRASARVSPPGHASAAVTVNADAITTRAKWPALSVNAQCPSYGLFSCNLVVRIGGVSSAAADGETFDLTDDSRLQCGNVSRPLKGSNFDPATTRITLANVSQTDQFYGACSVYLRLVESGGQPGPLYFGGTPSSADTNPAGDAVDLGRAERAAVSADDFTAKWPAAGASAQITYNGKQKSLASLTRGWSQVLKRPGDDPSCGTDDTQFAKAGDTATVPGNDCVGKYGDQTTGWVITVRYADEVDGATHSLDVALDPGAPATYQPCTPATFAATWGATKADGVTLTRAGGEISGCSAWSAELEAGNGTACGKSADAPDPSVKIAITCELAPGTDWTVTVTYRKPNGTTGTAKPTVVGVPPDS